MSDIASVPLLATAPALPAPDGAVAARAASRPAPAAPAPEAEPGPPPAPPARTPEALQQQIDRVLEKADTSLRFRVDEEAGRVVVAVVDRDGDVIMQVPDEAALALARRLAAGRSLFDAHA